MICLTMIVRNEEANIEQVLRNLEAHINLGFVVICDTGSTDNTIEIAKVTLQKLQLNGEIHQHKWEDFSSNRNLAITVAKSKCKADDYVLMWDADDRIINYAGSDKLSVNTLSSDKDLFNFRFTSQNNNNFIFWRPVLFKVSAQVKYKGVLHESLISKNTTTGFINTLTSLAGQSNPKKFEEDAILLEKIYQETNEEFWKSRYAYYCATSHYNSGNFLKAIEWFKKRLCLNGDNEELYWTYYYLGNTYSDQGEIAEAISIFKEAVEKFRRVEVFYQLSKLISDEGDYKKSYELALLAQEIKKTQEQDINCNKHVSNYGIDYQIAFCALKLNFSTSGSDIQTFDAILNLIKQPFHSDALNNEILKFIEALLEQSSEQLHFLFNANKQSLSEFLASCNNGTQISHLIKVIE